MSDENWVRSDDKKKKKNFGFIVSITHNSVSITHN